MRPAWRNVLGIGGLVLTLGIGLWYERPLNRSQYLGDGQAFLTTMTLQGAPGGLLRVEIADEPEERKAGLSRRAGLAPNHGMVFVFETVAAHPFWMKDMRFPLDIVYLREGVVTQVFASVPAPRPGEEPKTVQSSEFGDAVLELSAGEAARRGIVPGTYFQGLPSLR